MLVLELTESSLIGSADDVEVLHELRRRGCRIAIDDFGTGFSSLAYLTQLPIDILKLAAPFVDGVDHGGDNLSVAQAVLSLGESLGYLVVAEGIERAAESDTLRGLGCQLGQGYLVRAARLPRRPRALSAALEPARHRLPRPRSTWLPRAEPIPGSTYACCRVSPRLGR